MYDCMYDGEMYTQYSTDSRFSDVGLNVCCDLSETYKEVWNLNYKEVWNLH